MEYVFTSRSLRDIKKLPQDVRQRIIEKLDYFLSQEDPKIFSKNLTNLNLGEQRFRNGDYRVIFDIQGEKIVILRVGHRRSIYK